MIVYACLLRSEDGIPLSATNNYDKINDYKIQEGKRIVKLLSKYVKTFPSKISIQEDYLTLQ